MTPVTIFDSASAWIGSPASSWASWLSSRSGLSYSASNPGTTDRSQNDSISMGTRNANFLDGVYSIRPSGGDTGVKIDVMVNKYNNENLSSLSSISLY